MPGKRNARTRTGAKLAAHWRVTGGPVQQRDLFTRRWRGPPRRDPKEHQIQIAVMQHFKLRGRPGVLGWHTANGELREDALGAKLKAMGVLPGVSDLTFTFPPLAGHLPGVAEALPAPVLFLELKSRRGKLTAAQEWFRDQVRAQGHIFEWADSLDEAIRILKQRGAIT